MRLNRRLIDILVAAKAQICNVGPTVSPDRSFLSLAASNAGLFSLDSHPRLFFSAQASFKMLLTLFHLLPLALFASYTNGQNVIYPSAFVDPDYVLAKQYGDHTLAAQKTIISWADLLAERGPWSALHS